MLPARWFIIIAAAWVVWRAGTRAERLLVADRSRGWRALLIIGGFAYAVPAAIHGNRWAVPIVLLAVDAALSSFPPVRWPRRPRPHHTTLATGGAEVIPLHPR